MGMTALVCSICGKFRVTSKVSFMDGYVIFKNQPVCKECADKKSNENNKSKKGK